MRGVRASALLRAAPAPDEDGFTLAARAVERLGPGPVDLARITRAILVGDLPTESAEDLARFLGAPIEATSSFSRTPTLTEAVGAALARDPPGPALVVAVSIPSAHSTSPAGGAAGPDRLAIALWFEERGEAPVPSPPDASGSLTVDQFAHEARALGAPWASAASAPPQGSDARTATLSPDLPVAQGAYVPWPRYTEGSEAHWRLAADRCGSCGVLTFPPRGRCRSCGATAALTRVRLDPDSGRVVASTRIGPGGQPTEFDDQVSRQGPYGVVVVEFEGGARATLQVADHAGGPLPIGARVRTELRRSYPMEGRWRYSRKAIPLPDPSSGPGR